MRESDEWLETDGLGGFASGTARGIRTRRYHALLLGARRPPAERFVLVNGLEAWLVHDAGSTGLSSQRYGPDVVHPDGAERITAFTAEPWPTFDVRAGASTVRHEVFVVKGAPLTVLRWRRVEGDGRADLRVRLFHSGRDFHALQRKNDAFDFGADRIPLGYRFRPYRDVPAVLVYTAGAYEHAPEWFTNVRYAEETARGLDDVEDVASPGVFRFDLAQGDAWIVLAADLPSFEAFLRASPCGVGPEGLMERERARRAAFATPVLRAAGDYLARRGDGLTVMAGFPWFGDWGRDTFIATRGLCLATGRFAEARRILEAWTPYVSEGQLPNRFPDQGEAPEYNSVDASLWFVIAAEELLALDPGPGDDALRDAVDRILDGYVRGTRFGIRRDDDGLLACGETGWQLTWMDAKVGNRVITPRVGKPVEIQALFLNALALAGRRRARFQDLFEAGLETFRARFPDPASGGLFDVVDADHVRGKNDGAVRPNQILAIGGLPRALLEGDAARAVVDLVERTLLTPAGLRTLTPDDPGYRPVYEGGVAERDSAYHNGTVWPWLMGPFVEAWLRVRGGGAAARREARSRFLEGFRALLGRDGLGHLSEIHDAQAPHRARGCPFQAWSLGELLRIERLLAPPRDR